MFRRFATDYNFINDKGERQRIPRGWAGEVSDALAKEADAKGATQKDAKGQPLVNPAAPMAMAPLAMGTAASMPDVRPVSEAKVVNPVDPITGGPGAVVQPASVLAPDPVPPVTAGTVGIATGEITRSGRRS